MAPHQTLCDRELYSGKMGDEMAPLGGEPEEDREYARRQGGRVQGGVARAPKEDRPKEERARAPEEDSPEA